MKYFALLAVLFMASNADAFHRHGRGNGGCQGNSGGCQGGQGGYIQHQYQQPKGEQVPPPKILDKMADCPQVTVRVYAVQDSGSCGNGGGRRLFGRRGGCH